MSSTFQQTPPALRQTIRGVIFDYGKVLCQTPPDARVERIAAIFGFTHKAFWEAFNKHRPPHDMGLLTTEDFWRKMADEAGIALTAEVLAQLHQWDIEMWICLEHSMIRWAESLHVAGYKTAILSNAPVEFAEHARRQFQWLGTFDVCIFSAELKIAKPDPEIFRHCLDLLGIEAEEALFIDDVEHNVRGAREAGITSIQFESVAQLATELDAMGFQPLPSL